MNKIVTVFRDNYDWHALGKNDLVAFPEAGCRNTSHCLVHRGAYEAWQELKVGTNDFAVVKENQGDLVWSSSGHGERFSKMQPVCRSSCALNDLVLETLTSAHISNHEAARVQVI